VRTRVDGVLHETQRIPRRMAASVTTRLKVLAKMDIAERRRPQDGRITLNARTVGRLLDIRVAVLPTVEGEQVVMRLIDKSRQIPTLESLGLSESMREQISMLIRKPTGALLVTGPTGSGKSTTLAAMIDKINSERQEHIVTVEDPIEYLHPHKKCLVNQREVNADTQSFKRALKYILRQDPDVVLIGEMRDLETIEAALTVAETGHLVFATLHTNSAVQTINRILDVFPPYQQPQVRAQLSFVLEGVISQILIPKASGNGRVLAMEIMIPNPAIRNLIREEKVHQLYSQMQVGQAKFGMQTMNQSLLAAYLKRNITLDDAVGRSSDPEEFRNLLAASPAAGASQGPVRKV